ncbi:hypothetical protein NDU88_001612 [Pleurodeles waltl]|uniref:Uncharacterized protein n=1 Tax=Pleurodeles waltl TaxID=8319 RepID=A0AAV7VY41_PLEWA|nr:hypothetical protein NDU88_001612 [Pleurodeles waltl]
MAGTAGGGEEPQRRPAGPGPGNTADRMQCWKHQEEEWQQAALVPAFVLACLRHRQSLLSSACLGLPGVIGDRRQDRRP